MIFGDCLKNNINILSKSSTNKRDDNAFWNVLKHIAIEDIKGVYPDKVSSDIAIEVYYIILKSNENKLPKFYTKIVKSNGQERYRVLNRNLWSTNAFHSDGLAKQKGIIAYKEINESRNGSRVVYQGDGKNVD